MPVLARTPERSRVIAVGGLAIGVRQPDMQRHQGNFNGKSQQEPEIDPEFQRTGQLGQAQSFKRKGKGPGLLAMKVIKTDDAEQHEQNYRRQ